MSNETYFSLQGELWLADRDANGMPSIDLRWAFNCPKLEVTLSTQTDDVNESYSGQRLLDDQMESGKSAKVSVSLHGFSPANLALGLYSTAAKIATGSVVDEPLPAGMTAGQFFQLDKRGVSNLVVKDSAAVPITVPAAKVGLYRPYSGIGQVMDITGMTQPLKASYDYADADLVPMFTNVTPKERFMIFDGVNTRTGKPVVCEIYRVKFNPISNLALINEKHGTIDLDGVCLFDRTRMLDPELGPFGRFILPSVAG